MLGGGLAVVLLGVLLGVLLAPLTLGLAVFSLRRDTRGARIAGRVALIVACLAVFFSFPVWRIAFTGKDTYGEKTNVWDDSLFSTILLVEGGALLVSITAVVVRAVRTRRAPPGTSEVQ